MGTFIIFWIIDEQENKYQNKVLEKLMGKLNI